MRTSRSTAFICHPKPRNWTRQHIGLGLRGQERCRRAGAKCESQGWSQPGDIKRCPFHVSDLVGIQDSSGGRRTDRRRSALYFADL